MKRIYYSLTVKITLLEVHALDTYSTSTVEALSGTMKVMVPCAFLPAERVALRESSLKYACSQFLPSA